MRYHRVYLVVGKSGSYDDVQQWNVIAFESEKRAELYAKAAKITGDEFINVFNGPTEGAVWWCGWGEGENILDPKARILDLNKDTLSYSVEEILVGYDTF